MPARTAYRQLQAIRDRLPQYRPHARPPQLAENILALADAYDVYWFDAFGVLNVGPQPIPGAVEAVAALRERGKQVFVLSNAASVSKPNMVKRFTGLGFDFSAEEIVTSRDAVLDALAAYPRDTLWGLIGLDHSQEDLDARGVRYLHQDDPHFHDAPDGYLFLATANWDDARQQRLLDALAARPRPLILGNPDLIAPCRSTPPSSPAATSSPCRTPTSRTSTSAANPTLPSTNTPQAASRTLTRRAP